MSQPLPEVFLARRVFHEPDLPTAYLRLASSGFDPRTDAVVMGSGKPVEETGGYGFFVRDGKQVAGYGPVQSEGQPPAWSSYVTVTDPDETAEKVRQGGGDVLFGPIDLPADSGRMAVIADPEGAVVSTMQPIITRSPRARAACTMRSASRRPPDLASLTLIPSA